MSEKRPIEPEMQYLWEHFNECARLLDYIILELVGERRMFTIMVHPSSPGHASLSITNAESLEENYKAVAAWLAAARKEDACTVPSQKS